MFFNLTWLYLKKIFKKPKSKKLDIKLTSIPNIPIKDISLDLPRHQTRRWKKRPLNIINHIIIHQTAAKNQSLKGIAKYHITPSPINHISQKGAPGICYHYGIEPDGQVYKLNDEKNIVWHCKGSNTNSIGVLVNGCFKGPKGLGEFEGDEPTIMQLHSLKRLLNIIAKPYKRKIFGHCDKNPAEKSACPGYSIMKHINRWKHDNII